jgi:hypothetical protein
MDDIWPDGHRLAIPAIASAGAAVLHAAAAGAHAETVGLARVFIALAVAQAAAAVVGFIRADRRAALALIGVNGGAALGWAATRLTGLSWIDGLQVAERPGLADTIAATLALVALAAAASTLGSRSVALPRRAISSAALLVGVLTVPGLADATAHDHGDHGDATAAVSHEHGSDPSADGAVDGHDGHDGHDHIAQGSDLVEALTPALASGDHGDHSTGDHESTDPDAEVDHSEHTDAEHAEFLAETSVWPRPWDPTAPIDFSGVPGVTGEQLARAEQLTVDTLRELPRFADVASLAPLGYRSIGDQSTGFEHYINTALIDDDKFLDPTAPESLVYEVDGDDRTLVSAMFIAAETPIDDPTLTEFAGPLMQWHVHDNLCWGLGDDGVPVVRGVVENFGGSCPPGTVNAGGENPMVHVWIAPHECGPFAALEGHGAGQANVSDGARTDQCGHDHVATNHDGNHGDQAAVTTPYDPELPIDLGGVEGVTPQQQAYAENLVAATVRDLPQWADLDVVEAAGFRSIGDGATGHEHFIQWDWIDDDTILDPDFPESLVFEPQPDGSKRLVSAMYMLPSATPLDEVPDVGGALMQWHVHGDLCFTDDPEAPQVGGAKPVGSTCAPPLVDATMAPMIHVWITPHECGPFAALDGIGAGQVPAGETTRCDSAHGAH